MKKRIFTVLVFLIIITSIISITYTVNAAQYIQYVRSGIYAFPDSYQEKLKELSSKYPEWKFQAYYTGISWNELMEKERDDNVHRNRVHVNSDLSWKHNCNFVEGNYTCASDAIVAYYLDPRNFLNEKNIFQFVESSYNEKQQTESAIQKSVKNTFLDQTITCKDTNGKTVTMTYSKMIVEAAKQSNISAFYIRSKIIQEVGVNGSDSVKGTYPGYEGYYNFYNYGAADEGNPIQNGLEFARQNGWNSQYKSIVEGAKLIGKKYIEAGQNTAYFNKWDVVGTKILRDGENQVVQEGDLFWHQYMTNIQDPTSQSYTNYNLYSNNLNSEITFIIPVYNNMPKSNPKPQDIKLQSISLYTTQLDLQVGQEASVKTGYISAKYTPDNVTDKVLYWNSSNENVVKVSEGRVTAIGPGEAILTATSRDGGKTATCKVTVTKIDKALQSIKMNQDDITLKVGTHGWVGVTYNPTNASDKVLYWRSSNEKVAKVNEGNITAISRGEAILTATSRDGRKVANCKITVVDPNYISLETIKINETTKKLRVGETGWIGVTYVPSNATNKTLTWTSSNKNVAVISEGNIKAIGEGEAILTAISEDGEKTASCVLTVNSKDYVELESISIKQSKLSLKPGETGWIGVKYTPSNATNKILTWTSSNKNVATVSEGNVTAINKGTAILTATSQDGEKTASCEVNVTDGTIELESISLKTTNLKMKKGEKTTIYVAYNPSNATDKVLTWTSSNKNVATVSEGNVTAINKGTAILTAISQDGGKTASCEVNVTDGTIELESIGLKTTNLKMKKGEKTIIYATYTPSNATDKVLTWTSSNENVVTVIEGNITALQSGEAIITAKSRDGGKIATCHITVESNEGNRLQDLKLKSNLEIVTNGKNKIIYAIYNPSNVTDKTLYWKSSDTSIVKISEGNITTIKPGVATITATSRDGNKTASCQVVVVNPNTNMQSIKLSSEQISMKVGDSKIIYAAYNPTNVLDKVIYWVSDNPNIAKVSEGNVMAIGKGTTTITAVTRDGGKVATCIITVQ